jgi:CheY-like chemotaxis protein
MEPMTAPSQMPTLRRNRLLVAEDDQALRELMVQVLRSDGHEVVAVADGNDLLDTLAGSLNPKTGMDPFDLVISDVRMPGQSGLNAFAQVGYGPRMPPVVFMTAFGDEDVHQRAIHLGAIAVLDKPVDFDQLRLFVTSYLSHRHG